MSTRRGYRSWIGLLGGWLSLLAVLCLAATPIAAARASLALETGSPPAQYVLPDGTVPFLCLTGSDEPQQGLHGPHCPLCTLTGSFALPPSDPPSVAFAAGPERRTLPRQHWTVPPRHRSGGLGQRAPPL